MAWLGEGLSTLRGQITSVANFTKEVLSDGKEEFEADEVKGLGLAAAQSNIHDLQENCLLKDIEISSLRRRVEELELASGDVGDNLQLSVESTSCHGVSSMPARAATNNVADADERATLIGQVQHLEAENKLMRKTCLEYEEQLEEQLESAAAVVQIKQRLQDAQSTIAELQSKFDGTSAVEQSLKLKLESASSVVQQLESRITGLLEENTALAASLDDLDQQNQLVIDKLLATKKAVQDENSTLHKEISELQSKLTDTMPILVDVGTDSTEADDGEVCASLLKLVPFELEGKGHPHDAASLVTRLVKQCSEDRWKRETLERKISTVMAQLREAEATVTQREAELVAMRHCLQESNADSLAVIPENSEEAEEMERRITGLEEQLREVASSKDNLKEEVQKLRNQLADTEQSKVELRDRYQADMVEWEGKFQELNNNQNTLRKELAGMENCTLVANRKLEEAMKSRQQLEAQLKCSHQNTDLQEKCNQISQQLDNSNREVADCRTAICDLEKQLGEVITSKNELVEECQRLQGMVSNCRDQNVLEHEVEKWQTMAETTERQLEDALRVRSELEDECKRLFGIEKRVQQQEHLTREVERLSEVALTTEQVLAASLEAKQDLELKLGQLQAILEDQRSLKEDAMEWREAKQAADQQLQDASLANAKLTAEISRLKDFEGEAVSSRGQIEVLHNKLSNFLMMNTELKTQLENSQLQVQRLHHLDEEIVEWKEKVRVTESQLHETEMRKLEVEKELRKQEGNIEKTDKEKPHADEWQRDKSAQELESLKSEKNRMLNVLDEKTRENSLLKSENNRLVQLISEEKTANSKLEDEKKEEKQFHSSEESLMARETIANLSEIIKEKDGEVSGLVAKCEALSRLAVERDELVRTVQVKHAESVEYHREIQRLSTLLSQEVGKSEQIQVQHRGLVQQFEDKQKALTNTRNELIAVKLRLDKLEQRNHASQDIVHQNHTATKLKDSCNSPVEDTNSELARLMESLQKEATRNKYLQNEVQEAHEKEASLLKELGRLRRHLALVEDSHTTETVGCEAQVSELRARLAQAEDRAKSCSTALTSAQVRGNQQVEALQAQATRASLLRDEAQGRLSAAEDQVLRHAAALTNLQGVLEQFQRDKDRDITVSTARLEARLRSADERCLVLGADMSALEAQLAEAKEGLSAAARLTEQLDKKAMAIQQLKEEVQRLNDQLQTAETREKSASLNSEGKVDKYLVKNLLIGYLVAPAHTKAQALRIIATVLDFNHEERCRVGLEPGPQATGWFGSFMHPSTGPSSNQSLSEAFVRFLENESRPQPQLRLLPAIKEPPQSETNTNVAVSGTRSPLLLADVALPTMSQFPVARNSSSILKDVLKDS